MAKTITEAPYRVTLIADAGVTVTMHHTLEEAGVQIDKHHEEGRKRGYRAHVTFEDVRFGVTR